MVCENIVQSFLTFSSPSATKPLDSNLPTPGPSCLQREGRLCAHTPPGSLSAQDNVHCPSRVLCLQEEMGKKVTESVCLGAFLASAGMRSPGAKLERGGASSPSESASPWVCLRRVYTPDMASACRDALGPPPFQNTCYSGTVLQAQSTSLVQGSQYVPSPVCSDGELRSCHISGCVCQGQCV